MMNDRLIESATSRYTDELPPNRSILASGLPTSSVSSSLAHASMSSPTSSRPFPRTPPGSFRRPLLTSARPSWPRSTLVVEKDADDLTSPDSTRGPSTPLSRSIAPSKSDSPSLIRSVESSVPSLPIHLYNEGLRSGKHSDITIHAFDRAYQLHRLLLDRAPFFASALSSSWNGDATKSMHLQPQDVDSNITQTAFELALKRLYGCHSTLEEDGESVGLFATACWLEMPDLIEISLLSILRGMTVHTVGSLIKLVTANYYGKHGERILASAKAFLCREGWGMPICSWDEVPGSVIHEVASYDGFYVPSEWQRYVFAKTILDRHLQLQYVPNEQLDVLFTEHMLAQVYASETIVALLALLRHGIHYMHLSFEQLQKIRNAKDVFGRPILTDQVIGDALWAQLEFRQKVLNASESHVELGLSHAESGRFEIPCADSTSVVGGDDGSAQRSLRPPRTSVSVDPVDVQWASEFNAASVVPEQPKPFSARYSTLPPFRFSAELPNPRQLKEKKRMYSQTVKYAGSSWNIYMQKNEGAKGMQVGVYLHRAKEKEPEEQRTGNVDARISQVESLLRGHSRMDTTSNEAYDMPVGDVASKTRDWVEADLDDPDLKQDPARCVLPAFVDARPTVRTYFKIYSPSRGGKRLSVYESAPDLFSFSQSWGWRSNSSLMFDDGLEGADVAMADHDAAKLRFMVTIGKWYCSA